MKKEILDFRFLVSVLLVLSTLYGQAWLDKTVKKTETQNRNFITHENENENVICMETNVGLIIN